ncbi:MAG: HYExAFE family protein [Planctomycetaceae bacterium]
MAIRSNHYDAAFEAWLRAQRLPYVAVDESRRALLADASLKSFDFVVYAAGGENLLVDVKGRRFPTAGRPGGHRWENWATRDDLDSLLRWQTVFGAGFRSVLLFTYDVQGGQWPHADAEALWRFRDREYAFYAVWADEFAAEMTTRSRSWDTVTLPAAAYRRLRCPLSDLLGPSDVSLASESLQVAAC